MTERIRIDLFEYLRFTRVTVTNDTAMINEQCRWCRDNLVLGEWDVLSHIHQFWFKHERDAVLFKLRWG